MRIILNNKSQHALTADGENVSVKLSPKQQLTVEIPSTRVVKIKVSHTYQSHVDAQNRYILVADSEYTIGGVSDGAELNITHSRTGFRYNGIYDRFFVFCPTAVQSSEEHSFSNTEELLKKFNDDKKREKRLDLFFDYFIAPLCEFGLFDLLFFCAMLIWFWNEKGFLTVLVYGIGIIVLTFVINAVITFVSNITFPERKSKRKKKREKKRSSVDEELLIKNLEEFLSDDAMMNELNNPERMQYGFGEYDEHEG